jgi:hypothetical protein
MEKKGHIIYLIAHVAVVEYSCDVYVLKRKNASSSSSSSLKLLLLSKISIL